MNKVDIDKELSELVTRFKLLKKAIAEENSLSPARKAAAAVAESLAKKAAPKDQETIAAQGLANLLKSRNILGSRPPPRQPTDEEMFGHLVADPKAVDAAERGWGNTINNWLQEAVQPLNARFKTPEEEQAYWNNLKVRDGSGGGGEGGY